MPQLNNELFDASKILGELKKPARSPTITTFEIVKRKLKKIFFSNSEISNDDVKTQIQNGRFKDFPSLEYVLTEIFNDKKPEVIPEGLKDWSPSVTFHELNHKYGYFEQDQDLTELFNLLAVSGRKMTSIIENQAYDDEMAYKLMALFYDPKKSNGENFENIAKKFAKLVKTKQDKSIQNPYHDAFVVSLNPFPAFSDVKDLGPWKTFIEREGFKSLSIFAECATTQAAFTDIKDAEQFQLTKEYPRAHEHPKLAALCKKLLIKNDGFEAGLAQVQSGWPKKETDNLPMVELADKCGEYFWVKLPPQDMRAMYLGNLIPGCCQHIGGHSEQCIIDGMTLADNGFYVMLKAKSKERAKEDRLIGNEVNVKYFSIVAQSYAWKTENGNLCLDSIEWNNDRVLTKVIQDLMSQFSEKIFEEDQSIKHLTVGSGGQTPKGIYTQTRFPENMKQGWMYGDSQYQYHISSNMKDNIDELTKQLELFSDEFKQAFLYLAPYFEQPDPALETLLLVNESIETDLPRFLSARRVKLPPSLTINDFKKISFEEYQEMDDQSKVDISTVCKMFNASSENEFSKWLPTIPDEEFRLFRLSDDYSLETKIAYAECLNSKERMEFSILYDLLENAISSPNASQNLQKILGMFSSEDQLALINQKSVYGTPIIHLATNHPEALQTILALCPEYDRIEGINQEDEQGRSIFHNAASKPESLKIILELYPDRDRLKVIEKQDTFAKSILFTAASNPESLKMILDLYLEKNRLEAVKQENKYNRCVLYTTITRYPESFKTILELLPEPARLEVIKKTTNERTPVLFTAADSPKILKAILELLPERARPEAVMQKDRKGNSVLHYAGKPESLKMILNLYPESDRLAAIRHTNENGDSVLHQTIYNPKSLKAILELLPESARLEAVSQTNKYGRSVLDTAAKQPESLRAILELLPERARPEAVKQTDRKSKSVLYTAVKQPKSLKMILDLYPESDLLAAIRQGHERGESVLYAATRQPESLKMILGIYPESDRLEAVGQPNKYGGSVLNTAALQPELLKAILELLPENARLEAVTQENEPYRCVLYKTANLAPRSFETILQSLPDSDQLEALSYSFDGDSAIRVIALSSKLLRIIFESLSENNIMAVMKIVNHNGKSLFDYACQYPEQIKEILTRIPENQRYSFVTQKNILGGNTALSKLIPPYSKQTNIESLKAILELLPEGKRLDAVLHTVKGTSVLSSAVNDPTILKTILELLPKEQVFKEITTKHKENISIVGLANKSPELLKFIKSSVLETLQKTPEAHDCDDPHNEARQIVASAFGDSSHQDKHGSDPKLRQ